MIRKRPAAERGHANHGWLDTWHTFSFASYHDPGHQGFRALRVINDDTVQPDAGFTTHGHRDMEIVTYVLDGALAHRDSLGTGSVLRPGDVQRMSAGRGVEHSEFNASATDPLRLLQIWILPERPGGDPGYEERHFPASERQDRLRLIVAPDGADGALRIGQDVRIHAALLSPGVRLSHELAPGRHSWLQVARGEVALDGVRFATGDGAAISEEPHVDLTGLAPAEVLLFDLA